LAIPFLQELLRIDSTNPPGNEQRIAQVLASRWERIGLPGKITRLEENRSNFEVRLKGKGEKTLFFCGHMDTVSPGAKPWDYSPFAGEWVENRLYGRGASDMKSGLAAMMLAMEELYLSGATLHGDLVFLATAGEEVDSCGARHFFENVGMSNVDAIVIGEPTNEKVVIGHKGALWLEIVTYGKTAHGSMPEQGINAIDHMSNVIELIQRYKLAWRVEKPPLGRGSMAITEIGGGIQTNVIPDQCYIRVDIRSVPPKSHEQLFLELQQQLSELQNNVPGLQVECRKLLDRSAVLTDVDSPIIQTALKIKGLTDHDCFGISYYTDASVLNSSSSIPTLIYGPGDEKLAHQPNEWVDVGAYLRSIAFYRELAVRFLGE
jgi:succinyl-diaminopimelate desuccinylase